MDQVDKENKSPNLYQKDVPSTTQELKILEWRFNQFMGEKLSELDMSEEENRSYIISEMKMTENGDFIIVGDRGGRVIIFHRSESKKKKNTSKLNYLYEFSAYDRDFDVHRSVEYSEMVRAMCLLPTQSHDKIDILSCGYRTIKLHRVFNSKIKIFSTPNEYDDDDTCSTTSEFDSTSELHVPRIRSVVRDVTSKCKMNIQIENSTEINSLSVNKYFQNQFICSDDSRVLLWDMNHTKEVFNIIDLDTVTEEDANSSFSKDNPEKITKSVISPNNPHLISFGTNNGNIRICDTRVGSDCMYACSKFLDEFQNFTNSSFNLTKTLFSSQIMAVHDLNFNLHNENLFASRHFLSVNIWDQRNSKQPVNKFLVYEPIISKLSHLYTRNYLATDKFSLSTDSRGKFIMTGGYNNMFHVFDIEQKFNTQITVDNSNEKMMNTNIIRKINSKGSCFYKKDDPSMLTSFLCMCFVDNILVIGGDGGMVII